MIRRSLLTGSFAAALTLLVNPVLASSAKDAADASAFVRFKPIIVTLVQDDRPAGLLSVTVSLQMASQDKRPAAEALRTKYIDAFTRTLLILGQSHVDPRRPLDIPLLARELQKAADRADTANHKKVLVIDANTRTL